MTAAPEQGPPDAHSSSGGPAFAAPAQRLADARRPTFAFVALAAAVLCPVALLVLAFSMRWAYRLGPENGAPIADAMGAVVYVAVGVCSIAAIVLGIVSSMRRERARLVAGIAVGIGAAHLVFLVVLMIQALTIASL